MELLLVPVPLFDCYMSLEAYVIRYHFANFDNDAAPQTPQQNVKQLLKALEDLGLEALTGGNPVLIPITTELLPQLVMHYKKTDQETVFLLQDVQIPFSPGRVGDLVALRRMGFKVAATQTDGFLDDPHLLNCMDYVIFGKDAMAHSDRRAFAIRYKTFQKGMKVVATGLEDQNAFERAMRDGFDLFDRSFHRPPKKKRDSEFSPVKINLINLLNVVRDEQFEFKEIAEIVRRDPALSYSLMRFINSPYLGIRHKVKSIQQAVTILGQIEVRKWVAASVFRELGSDRPTEWTRISLMRARFAEELAELFGMEEDSSSLFLMGLFSELDTMLDTDMETALSQVMVTDEIADALVRRRGRFYPLLKFITDYDSANWAGVIAACVIGSLPVSRIYRAYKDTVGWYHDLVIERSPLSSRMGPTNPTRSI